MSVFPAPPPLASQVAPACATIARLVIVEDSHCLAQMLHLLCTECWGLHVTAVSHTGEEGLQAVAETRPDLVLLDIGLPDVAGLSLLPRLRQASPGVSIIIFSALYNDYVVGKLQDTDWDGAIDKMADGVEFIAEAIRTVRRGHRYISPAVRRLLQRRRDSDNPFNHTLSNREEEILTCISHALSDEEIADRLSIAAATVKVHRKRLLRKLSQPNTPKLMNFAQRHGYGSLPLGCSPGPET